MKTDNIFYQLFQTFPTLLFELLGETPENSDRYQFLSQEVKELSSEKKRKLEKRSRRRNS